MAVPLQCGVDLADESRQFAERDGIVRDIGRDDIGRELDEGIRVAIGFFCHETLLAV